MNLYHISEKPLGKFLRPRIPKNFMTASGYEDNTTSRVSFCPSIEKCLMALSADIDGKEFYVYKLVKANDLVKPSEAEVPDSKLTEEFWSLGLCEIEFECKINNVESYGSGIEYDYGDKKARLFNYTYEVVKDD